MLNLKDLTIEKARGFLKTGEFTVKQLVDAYVSNINKKNNDLRVYLGIYSDLDEQVSKAQKMIEEGTATALTGIPFAIKDNILYKGEVASAASLILENHIASYDSTVISLLKKAGAIVLGRTNMDEFAMGSSTQMSAFGITKNPIDPERVPGGSSGGSAASVAADMSLAALGTDTCGSVRQPASFCGLVGIKPTYGAFSRHGIIAMGNSLDQVAPFTKTVNDSEVVFNALSKYDSQDATSVLEKERDFKEDENKKKKIGVPWGLFEEGVDKEVMENFKESIDKLKGEGYEILDIDLPYSKYSLAVYYVIMPAEVSTNLSRYDGVRYGLRKEGVDVNDMFRESRSKGFGKESRRRIMLGTYVLSHGYYDAYYNKAWDVRRAIMKEYEKAFEKVGYIATPTTPSPAFKIGEKLDDPVAMYLCDIFAAPANLTGNPAIAIPSGFTEDGLPLSVQFMAPHFAEKTLFELGKNFEKIR